MVRWGKEFAPGLVFNLVGCSVMEPGVILAAQCLTLDLVHTETEMWVRADR